MKNNSTKNSFDNILFTLKRYKEGDYELLYISSEVRELINGDTKFYHESFFRSLFPTLPFTVFEFLFEALGTGEKIYCPIIIKETKFQFVQIEGYIINQEDGSYLITALISPQTSPNHVPYAWLITDKNAFHLSKNKNLDSDWKKFILNRFPFFNEVSLQELISDDKTSNSICIFPDRLYLTKETLAPKVSLFQLEYHDTSSARQARLPKPQENNLIYYELDTSTGEMRMSGAIEKILGYKTSKFEKFKQTDWKNLIHPDDRKAYKHSFEHSNLIVYKFLHADGHYIFLQDEIEKIQKQESSDEFIIGVLGDISELKEIEKNLLDHKTVLDELTSVVPGIVYLLKAYPDGKHKYIFVSEGSRDLAGIEPHEILMDEKAFEDLIIKEDLNKVIQADRTAYHNNHKFESQFRIKTKKGDIKWIHGASNKLEKYHNESIWAGLFIDITQSKLNEEEAFQQQAKYKLLFNENPVSIFHYDKQGDILSANKAFLSSLGLTDDSKLIGKNIFDLVGPQKIKKALEDSFTKGYGNFEGIYFSYYNQKVFQIRFSAKSLDSNSFQAIVENIPDQEYVHNILAELTEKTSKYSGQDFFDILTNFLSQKLGAEHCFIAEIDNNNDQANVISFHSDGVKQENFTYQLTHSPCEICINSSEPLIILNNATGKFPNDVELRKFGINTYMGVTISDINGKNLGMLVLMDTKPMHYSPVYESVLKILADRIGAELGRLSYEKKLIASELLYRSIAINFPNGTIEVLDCNFVCVYTDGKEYMQQGIDPAELLGKSILDRYSTEIAKKIEDQLSPTLQGSSVTFEISIENQHYLKNAVPLRNELREIERILLVTQNITETKKSEEERSQLIKDLKSQNEELQRFAYIISHNLRAPIVNITALLDLYNGKKPEDPENKEIIDNLKVATNILNNTLQDLIDVVAIKKNKLPKIDRIDFKLLTNNIETSLSKQIEESGANISKDFSGVNSINYIYSHLENFLTNLTTNAIKYRDPKRPLHIQIKTYESKEFTVIEFKDNGIGIDLKRYGDRLFGLYQRFHSHVEGKGLGLYLIREQIRAHDGNLFVESEVGKGTTFYIYLKNLIINQEGIIY
ncbi:PAS domain S-box protein [Belliella kenyensis]|uniref:histidine kinase n=1 Tax=Belliella kenyensis TaxID=1472724 RepID=A0ABV8ENY7_9BACT|nr:PAS domain S-box protein [Belliella kenyensis]MCH7401672.1 PAS domain S-box protein [Belliella kenyensis]MDN3603050.1 PAS domain S-box protein [Belliella kenyensis]